MFRNDILLIIFVSIVSIISSLPGYLYSVVHVIKHTSKIKNSNQVFIIVITGILISTILGIFGVVIGIWYFEILNVCMGYCINFYVPLTWLLSLIGTMIGLKTLHSYQIKRSKE